MSARFDERGFGPDLRGARLSAWPALALALALAGCASSGPQRPAEDPITASAGAPADDEAANERGRRARRDASERDRGRRGRSEDDAADEALPEDALRAHELAIAAMRRGDFTEAELELEHLILAHPDLPGPYVNAAIVYRRGGRDDEALTALENALAIDPAHPEANNLLGILLRERGDFESAEAAYRRALEGRPDYASALYNLGVLLDLYLHRKAEALAYYEQYQSGRAEPDETVARWIIDLRRLVGEDDGAARVARGEAR